MKALFTAKAICPFRDEPSDANNEVARHGRQALAGLEKAENDASTRPLTIIQALDVLTHGYWTSSQR